MPGRPHRIVSPTALGSSVAADLVTTQSDPWAILATQPGFAESMRRGLRQLEAEKPSLGSGATNRR